MENRRLYYSFVTRLNQEFVVWKISRLSDGDFGLQNGRIF